MIEAAMDALAPMLVGREQMRAALIAAERAAWVEPPPEDGEWLVCHSRLVAEEGKDVWGPWCTPYMNHGRLRSSTATTRRRVRRLEMPE